MPTTRHGRLVQINVNPNGGVPKHRVERAELRVGGVVGDKQRDLRVHGGALRAVSLFAIERITALQAEGHAIEPGSTGENLTISGLDWDALQIGDCLSIGDRVEIEITGYATPCKQIADSFSDQVFNRISQKARPGWSRLYAKVLVEGPVAAGDVVVVN